MPRRPLARHVLVLAAYAAVTLAFLWPLPANLSTALTGPPTGDTGVYVWNVWLFQHEALEHGEFPLFTTHVFSLGPRVDLSQHNYTPVAGLLGLVLVPLVGVVTAFNLIYLLQIVLGAYTMYLLARDVAGEGAPAWFGGLLFAFAPPLVARGTAHFSLAAAAALPLFLLLLRVAGRSGRRVHMIALGATMAWATYSDPYYGIYCLLLGAWHMAAHSLSVRLVPGGPWSRPATLAVNAWVGLSAALVSGIALTGGGVLQLGSIRVGLLSLHTPVLILTVAVAVRLALWKRPAAAWRPTPEFRTLLRLAPYGAATAVLLMLPLLAALVSRMFDGRLVTPPVLWRSSMPGVDLLAFLLPNPNHPLVRPLAHDWLASQPGGFVENVASIPVVAVIALAAALLTGGLREGRYWLGMAAAAASLALGPFIRVAGVNLLVPTPWTLARYLPVIDQARAPARFTALTALAAAAIGAVALSALIRRYPRWRVSLAAGFGALLLFELLPAPRPLYDARHSPVYDTVAADPRDVRVLELPFGVRDGLSSVGNFNASTQFNQTRHGKPLIGGYLSRVSQQRVRTIERFPVLRALMTLSAGEPLPAELEAAALERASRFVRDARVGYVVIAWRRAPRPLVEFAVRALDLELIAESDTRALYRPRASASPAWLAHAAAAPPAH